MLGVAHKILYHLDFADPIKIRLSFHLSLSEALVFKRATTGLAHDLVPYSWLGLS